MDAIRANLLAGWLAILSGVAFGAILGLFFYRDDWMGGYGSFRRRMLRLGHISFFGLGFLNILFALGAPALEMKSPTLQFASVSFVVGVVAMPVCCFLTAWRTPMRHLFPIPVVSVIVGVVCVLMGGNWR
jgi:hypothetical protein